MRRISNLLSGGQAGPGRGDMFWAIRGRDLFTGRPRMGIALDRHFVYYGHLPDRRPMHRTSWRMSEPIPIAVQEPIPGN